MNNRLRLHIIIVTLVCAFAHSIRSAPAMASRRAGRNEEERSWEIGTHVASFYSLPIHSTQDFRSGFLMPLAEQIGLLPIWEEIFSAEREYGERAKSVTVTKQSFLIGAVLERIRANFQKTEGLLPHCIMANMANHLLERRYPNIVGGPLFNGKVVPLSLWRKLAALDLDDYIADGGEPAFFIAQVWPREDRNGSWTGDTLVTDTKEAFQVWQGSLGFYLRPEREMDDELRLRHVAYRKEREVGHARRHNGRVGRQEKENAEEEKDCVVDVRPRGSDKEEESLSSSSDDENMKEATFPEGNGARKKLPVRQEGVGAPALSHVEGD